jgi:AcrR family transcriptional regulator
VYTSLVVKPIDDIRCFADSFLVLIGSNLLTMPISDCEVRDPRIRRTRKLLQGALANLMQNKSFDEISVQDITEAATVNRATFYDHYTDKFALMEAMIAGGFHEFLFERQLRYEAGCPAALGAIIQATCDFLSQAHSGGACDRQTAFQPLMDAAIVKAIQRLLMDGLQRAQYPVPSSPELVAAAASAAIGGGVKQWLSMPERPPVNEVVAQLQALILPMLEADSRAESPVGAAAHPHR